jgi:hypothetical protein
MKKHKCYSCDRKQAPSKYEPCPRCERDIIDEKEKEDICDIEVNLE